VVMDDLGANRPKRIRKSIEQHDCELTYLPSYSPDYNPIEEAFAKIENLLSARPRPGAKRLWWKRDRNGPVDD
jgi:transposase